MTPRLAVPPSPHCPLTQPAGAAIVTPAPIGERASHDAWCRRATAERARLAAAAQTPTVRRSIALLDELLALDAVAWEARCKRGDGA